MNSLAVPRVHAKRTWPLFLALVGSFATYSSSDGKLALYAIAIGAMGACAIGSGFTFKGRGNVLLAGIAYLFIAMLAVLINMNDFDSFPLQTMAYPIVFLMVAGSAWRIAYRPTGKVALAILALFVANGAVALVASIFRMDHIPIIGDVALGRAVFFTSHPSASGLVWNVNYYAATQGAGFWLLFSYLQRGALPRSARWLVILVGLSTLLGSSRSCTAALLGSVILYRFFLGRWWERTAIVVGATMLALSLTTLYIWAANDPDLNAGLRIYKGLNSRGDLWIVAVELISKAPWFGYGSPQELAQAMILGGAGGTTSQNSLLSTQLMFGLGGTLVSLYLILSAALRFALDRARSPADTALICLMAFCFVDSFVRSYMIGGIGPIPFLFVAVIVYFLAPKSRRV